MGALKKTYSIKKLDFNQAVVFDWKQSLFQYFLLKIA